MNLGGLTTTKSITALDLRKNGISITSCIYISSPAPQGRKEYIFPHRGHPVLTEYSIVAVLYFIHHFLPRKGASCDYAP